MQNNKLPKVMGAVLAFIMLIAATMATNSSVSAQNAATPTRTVNASATSQATVTVSAPVPPAIRAPCPTDGEMQKMFGFDKLGIKPVNTSVPSEGEMCKWNLQATGVFVFRGVPFVEDWQLTATLADALQTVAVFYGDGKVRDIYGTTFRYMPSYDPDHWVWDADRLMAHEFNFGWGQGRSPRYVTISGNLSASEWNGYKGEVCPQNEVQVSGLVGGEPTYWKAPDWEGGAWLFAVPRDGDNKPTTFLRLTASEVEGMDTWVDFYNTQAGQADSLVRWQNMPLADASYHCHPAGTSAEKPANPNGTNLVAVPPAQPTAGPVTPVTVTEVVVSTQVPAETATAAPSATTTADAPTSAVTAVVIGTVTSTPRPSPTAPTDDDKDGFFGDADECPLVKGEAPDGCLPDPTVAPTATAVATQPRGTGPVLPPVDLDLGDIVTAIITILLWGFALLLVLALLTGGSWISMVIGVVLGALTVGLYLAFWGISGLGFANGWLIIMILVMLVVLALRWLVHRLTGWRRNQSTPPAAPGAPAPTPAPAGTPPSTPPNLGWLERLLVALGLGTVVAKKVTDWVADRMSRPTVVVTPPAAPGAAPVAPAATPVAAQPATPPRRKHSILWWIVVILTSPLWVPVWLVWQLVKFLVGCAFSCIFWPAWFIVTLVALICTFVAPPLGAILWVVWVIFLVIYVIRWLMSRRN